jgi:hypothetical protein
MDSHSTHPTKEQVRAYMAGRGAAHRPPPAPAEIRRQLGWRMAPDESEFPLMDLCLLPTTCGQLTAQLVIDLWLAPSRAIAAVHTC